MCMLHPLSRPSSCEVSAHGAVTSSSLVPGAEGLIQTPPIYGGALWAWGMTAFGLTQSWGTTPERSISGQGMSQICEYSAWGTLPSRNGIMGSSTIIY